MGIAAQGAGRAMTGALTAPLGVGLDFESQMSRVEAKAFAGVSDRGERKALMAPLVAQAEELGKTTSYAASQVALAQAELAGAGFGKKAILEVTSGLLTMAKAGDIALESAADLSTGLINMYGLEKSKEDMSSIGDILAKTAADTKTNMSEMGEVFKYAGVNANKLGISLTQTASLVSALASNNIKASEAGTALRGIFSRLAAPTGAAAAELERLGIKTKDSSGNFKDISEIMGSFAKATKDLGNAEQIRLAKTVAGEEAAAAFLVLAKESASHREVEIEGIKRQVNGLKALEYGYKEAGGYAQRMSDIMTDNTKNSFDELSSSTEALSITIGRSLAPSTDWLTGKIKSLTITTNNLIKDHPTLTSSLAGVSAGMAGLLTVAGTLGATMSAFPFVVRGVSGVLKGGSVAIGLASKAVLGLASAFKFVRLAFLGTPLGWIAGIATVVGTLAYNWESVVGWMKSAKDTVSDWMGFADNQPEVKTLAKMNKTELAAAGVSNSQSSIQMNAPITINATGGNPDEIGTSLRESLNQVFDEQRRKLERRNYD